MLTAEEWTRDLKNSGVPPNAITDNVLWRLKVFGRLESGPKAPKDDLAFERQNDILVELEAYCAETLKSNRQLEPSLRGRLADVGARCGKARRLRGHFRPVVKLFGPSGNAKSEFLKHSRQSDARPTTAGNYWLECLDPKHRFWAQADTSFFRQWEADNATKKNFFDWLEEKGLSPELPQVQYLEADQRWKYRVHFQGQKAWYPRQTGQTHKNSDRELFCTKDMRSALDGGKQGVGIWVCSHTGAFYSGSHQVGHFHHSSFMSGRRVLAAGEWIFSKGDLLLITHKTGHYQASPAALFRALQLIRLCICLDETVVAIKNYSTGADKFVKAKEFLENKGNAEICAAIDGAARGDTIRKAAELCGKGQSWKDLPYDEYHPQNEFDA